MAEQVRPRGLPEQRDDNGEWEPRRKRKTDGRERKPAPRREPIKREWPRNRRTDELRRKVRERAEGRCERCGKVCVAHAHHRKLRSQGGPDHLSNLAALCAECHGWCHEHPYEAQLGGYIVPREGSPSRRAMFLYDGRLVLLDDDGTYIWEAKADEFADHARPR